MSVGSNPTSYFALKVNPCFKIPMRAFLSIHSIVTPNISNVMIIMHEPTFDYLLSLADQLSIELEHQCKLIKLMEDSIHELKDRNTTQENSNE